MTMRFVPLAVAGALMATAGHAATLTEKSAFSLAFTYSSTDDLTGVTTSSVNSGSASGQGGGSGSVNRTVTPNTGGVASNGLLGSASGGLNLTLDAGPNPGGAASGATGYSFSYLLTYAGGGSVDVGLDFSITRDFIVFLEDDQSQYDQLSDYKVVVTGGVDQNGAEFDGISFGQNADLKDIIGPADFDSNITVSDDQLVPFFALPISLNSDFNTLTIEVAHSVDNSIERLGAPVAPIPVPAAGPLLFAALGGLALWRRRR